MCVFLISPFIAVYYELIMNTASAISDRGISLEKEKEPVKHQTVFTSI